MRAYADLFGTLATMSSNGRGNAAQPDETAKPSRPSAGKGLQNFFLVLMFTSIPSATLILGLVLNHGSTAFHLSDLRNGYHPGPGGRGTLSLVWSCVSTIFTLVYVSVHPDIPNDEKEDATNEQPAKGLFGCADKFHAVARFLRRLLSLVFWPLMNIFAPSLIVLVASMEYQSARAGVESMKKLSGGQSRWTTRHAFFADMGGFELKHTPLLSGREFYIYFEKDKPNLDYEKIQEEIRDRSATSTVFKILTFLQASWFIAQSIVRGVERRAISQLEVTTCAYIFSLMVAYLFWMRKPYRVSGRIPLEQHILDKEQANAQQRVPTSPSSQASNSTSQTRRRHSANPGSARDYNNAEEGGLLPQENPARPPFNGGPSSFGKSLADTAEQPRLLFGSGPTPPSNAKPSGPTFRDARFTPFNRATYHSNDAWACELSCPDFCVYFSDQTTTVQTHVSPPASYAQSSVSYISSPSGTGIMQTRWARFCGAYAVPSRSSCRSGLRSAQSSRELICPNVSSGRSGSLWLSWRLPIAYRAS